MVIKVLQDSQTPGATELMEEPLDILILGAGWTATFLIPLLRDRGIAFAATTGDGRHVAGSPTLKWRFDPAAPDPEQTKAFALLPRARHVLITFPLRGQGQSARLTKAYTETHGGEQTFRFIQLGSTGIWQSDPRQAPWLDRSSPYKADDQRAVAEDELLGLGGCVLNLAGLWGGERDVKHWVDRVATTKEAVRAKTSLHMVHGVDVSRVIAGVVQAAGTGPAGDGSNVWDRVGKGQRWMVTDGFVYDWWSLFAAWSSIDEDGSEPIRQAKWVYELMREDGVRALPRSMEALGRCYDSRELWQTLGITPLKAGLGL
ncbi:hypothetical protein UCDDA912_g00326 [Diaporthe ampelina]|uniref:Uncharacterized protein n=1 Tax=Diaporthe ampelina TaxID=1214573 RepID=A0A0G2FZR3_9PEZI|nr:hypothetical protein UCDDA912_g00326 [Diaporthe ampelina]